MLPAFRHEPVIGNLMLVLFGDEISLIFIKQRTMSWLFSVPQGYGGVSLEMTGTSVDLSTAVAHTSGQPSHRILLLRPEKDKPHSGTLSLMAHYTD